MLMKLLARGSLELGERWNWVASRHSWPLGNEEGWLRLPNLLLGAATTWVLYLLGREMMGPVGAGEDATLFRRGLCTLPSAPDADSSLLQGSCYEEPTRRLGFDLRSVPGFKCRILGTRSLSWQVGWGKPGCWHDSCRKCCAYSNGLFRMPGRVSSHRIASSLAEYRTFGNGVARLPTDVSFPGVRILLTSSALHRVRGLKTKRNGSCFPQLGRKLWRTRGP